MSEDITEQGRLKTILNFARVVEFVQRTTTYYLNDLTKPHRLLLSRE